MKVAIVSRGRFHLLDLARELAGLGLGVKFYSYVPIGWAKRFGLPAECHVGLLRYVLPLALGERRFKGAVRRFCTRHITRILDRVAARILASCDVLIGLSGLCVRTSIAARDKYGALIIVDRGSWHILSQKAILDDCRRRFGHADTVPLFSIERELTTYGLADFITVPSIPAAESFLERGFSKHHLFCNPYGVDLTMFKPTPVPGNDTPVVLFVGRWEYQKGCDLLEAACRKLAGPVRLVHVGAIHDAPFPRESWAVHVDPVPQWKLQEWYAKADVFVLPSRQEGFGMVLLQAARCGLPIVSSDRTGGRDLLEMLEDKRWVRVVRAEDVDALARGIAEAIRLARTQQGLRDYLGATVAQISWRAYGERYAKKLEQELARRKLGQSGNAEAGAAPSEGAPETQ